MIGIARLDRRTKNLTKRIRPGEIAIIDHIDLDRVSAEVLPRLFEAFGPTGEGMGNGLGLHVSREAARAQGGDLVLESSGPDGCVFALTVRRDTP